MFAMEPWGYGGYGQFHMVIWIILAIAGRCRVAPTIRFLVMCARKTRCEYLSWLHA
jgi:hypothetical protein